MTAFLPVALFLLNNQSNSLLQQVSVVPNASLGIFQVLCWNSATSLNTMFMTVAAQWAFNSTKE